MSSGPAGAIVFLFNHDAAHQLAHTAGMMRATALLAERPQLVCAYDTEATRKALECIVGPDAAGRIVWHELTLPRIVGFLGSLGDAIFPATRHARLMHHADLLRQAAVIVSPERTCLALKKQWRGQGPTFVFVPHGAGDRAVSYHPGLAKFDYMLVGGQKVAEEFVAHGLVRAGQVRVIGYPKFDVVDLAPPPSLFNNGLATFVYNPHFDPFLSSWYDHGPALLDWFAQADCPFNLIFAPHVMLFRKRVHFSLEHSALRVRPGLRQTWRKAPNILIDIASPRLFNMTYTLAADAYIGDVSSQIYEFLLRPRPCAFIDVQARQRVRSPSRVEAPYLFWKAGDVVENSAGLIALLPKMAERWPLFRSAQEEVFRYTFVRGTESASDRGAGAILAIAREQGAG